MKQYLQWMWTQRHKKENEENSKSTKVRLEWMVRKEPLSAQEGNGIIQEDERIIEKTETK